MPNGMPTTRRKIELDLPPGRKIYFASDVHLGYPDEDTSREREKIFVHWLENIAGEAGALFLVGDIFDFWFDWRRSVPRNFTRTLGTLARMADRGVRIFYFYGNHDMWMKDYFEKEIGMEIVPDTAEIHWAGKRIFVAHGDGLGPGDGGYKILKKIFRSPLSQWLYRQLHPDWGIALAGFFSRWSRRSGNKMTTRFKGPEKEFLIQYALKILEKEHFDYFIFGHRHHVVEYRLNEHAIYLNIGDWLEHFSYLEMQVAEAGVAHKLQTGYSEIL